MCSVKKFSCNEYPLIITSSFFCIFLLVVSGTQCNKKLNRDGIMFTDLKLDVLKGYLFVCILSYLIGGFADRNLALTAIFRWLLNFFRIVFINKSNFPIGPFLLTNLLLEYMIQTANIMGEARIVNVTCGLHDHENNWIARGRLQVCLHVTFLPPVRYYHN